MKFAEFGSDFGVLGEFESDFDIFGASFDESLSSLYFCEI